MTHEIAGLITPAQYQSGRSNIFKSEASLTWFVRHHRNELAQSGALLVIAGRNMLHAERTDAVVLAVGKRAAAEPAASAA
jgi:hypothetical protein